MLRSAVQRIVAGRSALRFGSHHGTFHDSQPRGDMTGFGSNVHPHHQRPRQVGPSKRPGDVALPAYMQANPKLQASHSALSETHFDELYRVEYGDIYKHRCYDYACLAVLKVAALYQLRCALWGIPTLLGPTERQKELMSIEVDLSKVALGTTMTVLWQGKPVFIRHRTQKNIDAARSVPPASLRDPASDEERCPTPEWAIFEAICTHLGCIPVADAGDYKAFFCPCHGSHYDMAGRIRKGPAPRNLKAVPFNFLDENTVLIG
eukprot:NODE_1466_length_849_cov_69.768698_g1418_i0.p1 GENE.NODE_1466_length_849_cov_69.768698_g1418_i0~~NODE_1466_length_849_cov_69.768698_g1418_i0.p1  ORF type:complete len:263 (+),score=38.14 NODE_1466_length_849_cov_69.768698_g1418_i0:58-846(+)